MSGHAYSEDQLVEQPAIRLLAELGWQTASTLEEVFGTGGTLGVKPKATPSSSLLFDLRLND